VPRDALAVQVAGGGSCGPLVSQPDGVGDLVEVIVGEMVAMPA
jgi:hypothetical protein